MTCAVCGAALPPAARFCPACGAPLGAEALPDRTTASPAVVAPEPPPVRWTPPAGAAPVAGPRCPVCGDTISYTSLTLWHFLAMIVFFPAGLAVLAAPRRTCRNGHTFGAGVWVERLGVATVLAGIALIALLVAMVHEIAHEFRTGMGSFS